MHIILVVDDNWGISFNNRRQSRDRVLTQHVLELTASTRLWISESSLKLFPDPPAHLIIDNDFPAKAEAGDYCFVENAALFPTIEKFQDIIVFHWNRAYPSDQIFDRTFLEQGWLLTSTSEFTGHSHEKIMMERYVRR